MEQQEIWDDLVGAAWVQFADVLDAHSDPFGAAAMDALGPLDGAHVLDVGCGTGTTTQQLAARVGPEGHATGIDLSETMITRARDRAAGAEHASFVVGDVLELALDRPVDAVFSRFGVMFFADPTAAFTHLRSLTSPGGRIAFSAWRDPFSNPWMLEPVLASIPIFGPPELPAPGEPGPFSLATAEIIDETLTGAGWAGVEVNELTREQPFAAGDALATAQMVVNTNPVLAAGLAREPERRDDLVEAVAEALRVHEHDGDVVLAASASIVTATA